MKIYNIALLILLFFNVSSQSYNISGDCVPFGTRLSYGPYYSQQGNTALTQIYVTFNTLVHPHLFREIAQDMLIGVI